jgi:uncharacterized protein (DUF362 family)
MEKLTRREFLIRGSSAALGAAVGVRGTSAAESRPAEKSRVVLVRSEEAVDAKGRVSEEVVLKMLDAALVRFSGASDPKSAWAKYLKPSDTVGVKMNVMMNATRPEVVRGIVRRLLDSGVKDQNVIVWDRNEAGVGLEGVGVRDRRFGYDPKSHVSRIITERCSALINVPGVKAHWLAGIAVALKNWVGAIQGLNPSDKGVTYAIHADSCAECCQFNAMPVIRDKCRLVIVDALRPLCHAGPQVDPRFLWPYKGILVSTDPVAADTVCERIIQEQRDKMRLGPIQPPAKHVRLADTKYHLGNSDWDKIEIVQITV